VSAFHTVSAALLNDLGHALDEDVLVCGDRRRTRPESPSWWIGSRAAGRRLRTLELARIVEQFTPLLISINVRNKVRAGIKITGLHR